MSKNGTWMSARKASEVMGISDPTVRNKLVRRLCKDATSTFRYEYFLPDELNPNKNGENPVETSNGGRRPMRAKREDVPTGWLPVGQAVKAVGVNHDTIRRKCLRAHVEDVGAEKVTGNHKWVYYVKPARQMSLDLPRPTPKKATTAGVFNPASAPKHLSADTISQEVAAMVRGAVTTAVSQETQTLRQQVSALRSERDDLVAKVEALNARQRAVAAALSGD